MASHIFVHSSNISRIDMRARLQTTVLCSYNSRQAGDFLLPFVESVCMSGKACEERTQTRFLLDSGKTGPVDPVFFCQKPSLDLYGLFEPKTNPLDHSIQKIRVLLDRIYSPFLFSFIVLETYMEEIDIKSFKIKW